MDKLKRTSRRLQYMVLLCIFLFPLFVFINAAVGAWTVVLDMPQGITIDTTQIHGLGMLAVLLLGLVKPLAYSLAFHRLYRLLGLYRDGIVFSAANVTAIRRIGYGIATIDIAAMLQTLVAGPILTIFSISSGYIAMRLEVGYLVVGLFIVLVAYVMDMGRELHEQDKLVI